MTSASVIVPDYVGLIVCDTRRAQAWRAAFGKAGIVAVVAETIGDEADAGACKVSVPRRDLPAANALVTAVTRGERRLPGTGFTWRAAIAIGVVAALAAAIATGWR
jgi:hypothetical protein